ncbi:hypothetical protein GIB67_028805 [Kingdonia uniflora]|uniref:3'-5' exonuclease n=1 Tax=Kingdonia uniflora TaxID=39325 RepID=A0A7J7LTG0_9MAGN|nr:hypothetical protein GIB67_028805 [Kingdonia uniflora]
MNSIPDWDQPISQEELKEIEAAFETALSSIKRRKHYKDDGDNDNNNAVRSKTIGRRLPNWGIRQCSAVSSDNVRRIGVSNCEFDVDRSIWRSNTFSRSYPRNQVKQKLRYPALKFEGRIVYSRTVAEVEKATTELLEFTRADKKNMDRYILGFDIEWKPTFKRGETSRKAAVMQICGNTGHCYVMHIIHSGIPPILQSLLENPAYVKVGVCIANDAVKVMKDYGVCVKPLEDLSGLANQNLPGTPKKWSLASLTEALTCKELEKPNKIRLGNWEASELSREKLKYAATDAFASWHLYMVLKSFQDPSNKENVQQVTDLQSK